MAQIDDLEALAKRHGATSYRNRADTQNPAFGFSVAGLSSLLAEVRKQDDALIRQMDAALDASEAFLLSAGFESSDAFQEVSAALTAGRARLEGKK